MNIIDLKILSLSALMASSMISVTFAMDDGIDTSNPIGSVKAASTKFCNGDSPVRRTISTPKSVAEEEDSKASGIALVLLNEQREAKTKLAKVKADSDAALARITAKLEEDVKTARASAAQQIEEFTTQIESEKAAQKARMQQEMAEQRQLFQTQLDEVGDEISSKRSELYQLMSELETAKRETAEVKKDALLTRSGVAAAASYFNPLSYLGRGTPPTKPQ